MAAKRGSPYVWIDIDNPPQVLYDFPFVDASAPAVDPSPLTARDCGDAVELLALGTASFHIVGKENRRLAGIWPGRKRPLDSNFNCAL